MKSKPLLSLLTLALGLSFFSYTKVSGGIRINDSDKYAPEGMVAYAASYSSDVTSEPQYSTQNNKTFQYLNLGSTLEHYRGDSVKVGIIDSGINYDHEDFMVNSSTKVKGDSKYYSYQSSSWVYYKASQHGYSYVDDSLGHGTNVAATVAAAVNGIGGLGLAPNVELYVYKVTNSSNGYEFGAIQNALNDAKTLGLDVINMSFQSYENAVSYGTSSMPASKGCSTIMSNYLNQAYNAGITLVGAAGNYNTDEPSYPGSNDHVINVGSLDATASGKAGYSNYGDTIDLVAPGYVYVAGKDGNSSYKNTSGTSFSAPLVTAAIALYKQQNRSATPAQIESALYASCDPIDDSSSPYTNWAGHGSLNVAHFLGISEDGPSSITINNTEVVDGELALEVGDTFDLSWTVNGSGTFDDSVSIYAFDDNGTLSVDENGHITALAVGEDYVVIESNVNPNVYTEVYVSVTSASSPTVSSVTVSPSNLVLDLNGTTSGSLTATVNGTGSPSQAVNWSSSNTSIATVSNSGVVTAKAVGNATITATSIVDGTKSGTCTVTVTAPNEATLTITRNSFSSSGGYAWYDWTQTASNSASVSGKGELYTTATTSMQFNKSNGDKVAALYNSTAIPGSITKIEAKTASGTNRAWNAYVTSTACSASGSTLTFGSNKTTVGSNVTIGTSSTSLGTSSAGYSYFCLQENVTGASYLAEIKITFIPKEISSIEVKTAPNKLNYEVGDTFDPTGLEITAHYSDSTSMDVAYASAASSFTFVPSTSTALTISDTSIAITYENKTCYQAIRVTGAKTLSSISISGYQTSFVEGDTFSFGGTVTAHYSDSTQLDVTSSSAFSGYTMTSLGEQTVTVSYTYKGVTKTQDYNITVSMGTLTGISLSGQTTVYQKYSPFSFDGVCTANFANGYQKAVTPTSVTSPNMATAGVKTVTVTFTYNNVTKDSSYDITVNANRVVIEVVETNLSSTITWPSSSTPSISGDLTNVSATASGKTFYESSSLRLGTSNGGGTITINATQSITKVDIVAKYYPSYSSAVLKVDGQSVTPLTSSYQTYTVTLASAKTSFTVLTENSSNRINIQSITLYSQTSQEVDISSTPDCVGLESFIDNYMHMDYVDNLGYCKDEIHHYYSSARTAFNGLNEHQRELFTTNTAYFVEWNRLSTWAEFNSESLDEDNYLSLKVLVDKNNVNNDSLLVVVIMISLMTTTFTLLYLTIKKKRNKRH